MLNHYSNVYWSQRHLELFIKIKYMYSRKNCSNTWHKITAIILFLNLHI